jgi:hypothetical protein
LIFFKGEKMTTLLKFRKSFCALFLIMIFSMTIPACGGGGGNDDNTPSQSNDNQWGDMVWDQGNWG